MTDVSFWLRDGLKSPDQRFWEARRRETECEREKEESESSQKEQITSHNTHLPGQDKTGEDTGMKALQRRGDDLEGKYI